MTLKSRLLAAGAALLLSTGAALAVPATAQTDLNVRSGPGTQYPVVGSIQGGETVDVGSCSGSWCQVRFRGGSGFASRSYLALGGVVAPGPAVAVSPYIYDDDYGYGYYGYGPPVGIYAAPTWRHRRHGGWQGQPGWNGGRGPAGNWPRRGGVPPMIGGQVPGGFAGPPAGWQRPGTGIGIGAGAPVSAPRAVAPSAPAGGFGGSIIRGGQ